MAAWRFRQCPRCRRVMPAGELLTHPEPRWDSPWSRGEMRRECPSCGHRGRTVDFVTVAERHPKPREWAS